MLLLSAALVALMQTIPEYTVVEVRETPRGCEYKAEGRKFTEKQLDYRARVWARQERVIEVAGDRRIAFRCVGNAMFIVQNAGVERVSFTGKAIKPSVVLALAAQGCTLTRNGEVIGLDVLATEAKIWGQKDIEVAFQPDPGASFECVDSVVRVLKDNRVGRLGFVGNEQEAADPK